MTSISTKQSATVRTQLANGLTVIAIENPIADIVAAHFFIRAGHVYETSTNSGIFDLLAAVLTKGTHHRNALDIAETVESIGAGFGADVSSDYSTISLKTVSSDFETVLALAAEVIRLPSFPDSEIELERCLILQSLRSMKEQPFNVAYNQLREALYKGHPYGHTHAQTESCVESFTKADLLAAHQQYFRPDNMVVTVVGRQSPTLTLKLIEQYFGDWRSPNHSLPQLQFPPVSVAAQKIVTVQNTNQAFVILGHLAGSVNSLDYAALKIISTYLGNGLSSRLFVELREKKGLAYDVSAFYPTRLGTSQFIAYIGTAPENVPVALSELRSELARMTTTPLTAEELQVAKNKILGQYALGKQTNSQIAQTLGWYEVLGLGIGFDDYFQQQIAAVTIADVLVAAQRCLVNQVLSVLGPADAIESLR
ncbi:Peptidase M16 inactive domain family [Synechococcus sp. PCC 7335]|uniref:M16 family metallopeptidase n=1 Tax=Synechococcus sp. (strain ATCC 29403 / PCC 7335) TaxID=91464 RepID=UPI00017ED59E|nr:pitrilysin family protein [Synechococcus sp. PCC 7335]EDX86832.1 Peptidase M16 inactive domain family [Synechococcus sp. PCC 7335]